MSNPMPSDLTARAREMVAYYSDTRRDDCNPTAADLIEELAKVVEKFEAAAKEVVDWGHASMCDAILDPPAKCDCGVSITEDAIAFLSESAARASIEPNGPGAAKGVRT